MARILYISPADSPHDRRFLRKLVVAGYAPWFLPCTNAGARMEKHVEGVCILPPLSDVQLVPGSLRWFLAASKLRRVLRRLKPDLVHAGTVHTGGFFAALAGCRPLVLVSWGSDLLHDTQESHWARWAARFALRRPDVFLADCAAVRARALALGLPPHTPVVAFPWGVENEWLQPHVSHRNIRRQLGWQDCKIAVCARSFEPVHQPMTLLRGLAHSMHCHKNLRAILLGDGSLRRQAEEFIARRNLGRRIHLAGQVTEGAVRDYFAEADLYICATTCDGSSVSLLQAMALRLPVIVTDAGGNREWVREGVNGWLYPAGSHRALAGCIERALAQSVRWQQFGMSNADAIRRRANWDRNFGLLRNAYDDLLREHSAERNVSHAQLQNWKPSCG